MEGSGSIYGMWRSLRGARIWKKWDGGGGPRRAELGGHGYGGRRLWRREELAQLSREERRSEIELGFDDGLGGGGKNGTATRGHRRRDGDGERRHDGNREGRWM